MESESIQSVSVEFRTGRRLGPDSLRWTLERRHPYNLAYAGEKRRDNTGVTNEKLSINWRCRGRPT